jgi:flagellar biosynthesis protein FlhF
MRVKAYSAPNMNEAMSLIRNELGDDAIIVATEKLPGGLGVRITAALESADPDDAVAKMLAGGARTGVTEAVRKALQFHGVPERLADRMVGAARNVEAGDSPSAACAAALDTIFSFAPLPDRSAPRPFMLVGPPGSGKSITVAKLAARAVLKQRRVAVVTTDTVRAGATAQLAAFTRILEIELKVARGPEALARLLSELTRSHELIFIDTPSVNPFSERDMRFLHALAKASDVEPILVMAAGGDPMEAIELGDSFQTVGVTRLLATRLDTTRRLGAVLSAADAARTMFCDVTVSPHVASGLSPINPLALARLLLSTDNEDQEHAISLTEVMQ